MIAISGSAQNAFAEPSVYPTGTTIYDPKLAYGTFVVFGAPDHKTHVVDMNGHEVHRWDYAGFPSEILDPAVVAGAKGHVLVQLSTDERPGAGIVPNMPAEFRNRTIAELDWGGKPVWQWGENAPGGAAHQHHDWYRLPNGNTLVLTNALTPVAGFNIPKVLDDVIYEVTPSGSVAWKWAASEHLGEFGFTPEEFALLQKPQTPDYLHVNDMTALGPNHWFAEGDTRFDPDNIMIDSRNANFIVIIDKKTGKIVWRIGPNFPKTKPSSEIPRPVDQLSGQHDAHLIEEGLPGAGNLIVFDNQGEAGYPPVPLGVNSGSRVLEINPVTQQIVWQYSGENSGASGWTFYSSFISDARRLPNGNTFIDEGMNGRFFQITPGGKIVWEYVNPYFASTPVGALLGSTHSDVSSNWVYRAQPVPYDWLPPETPHTENAVVPAAGTNHVDGGN
ncbi:MAG: aryl-sulfate sulfotransferase [Rhizomicrobium sp.]